MKNNQNPLLHPAFSVLLILIFLGGLSPLHSSDFLKQKFKVKTPGKKTFQPIINTFSGYKTVIGSCSEGSSLGIYGGTITKENEFFYECNTSQAVFEEIFPLPGINGDTLLDFGFIMSREEVKQLYLIFSVSDRLYHYELVQELQDGKDLVSPENPSPLDVKYLKFYQLSDVNKDGTPEFINNIFLKDGQLTDWPDISDTLDIKKIFQSSK